MSLALSLSLALRGLKKLHPMAQTDRQTDGHGDSMTDAAQWSIFSENLSLGKTVFKR